MGLKFFEFFRRNGKAATKEVTCGELEEAAIEYSVRNLSFWVCVNMIANALGRCEFRTFRGGVEVFDREYYMWNFEPNVNQNSTAFIHKLISQLCQENEALIIAPRRKDGFESVVVADEWADPDNQPIKQNRYKGVVAGGVVYDRAFLESDVLHLRLHHKNIRGVISSMYQSYYRLISAAMANYERGNAPHWKVHISQMAQGGDAWAEEFQKMLEAQIKPFLESRGAILPEFDGYKYEDVGGKEQSGKIGEIQAMIEDIFNFTARAFQIPAVLIGGKVEAVGDANSRFLTSCIDPICDQLQEEITRKRYGFDGWKNGDYIRVDSSSIQHFDMFENAANVEKLVGSGAYCINDVRRAAGQAIIDEPWAWKHLLTKNIADINEATRALEAGKE